MRLVSRLLGCGVLAGIALTASSAFCAEMPKGFVYLRDVDPTILQHMRYAGSDNFVGRKVTGYEAAECVLTRQAAQALKAVQADIRKQGFTLKVYDCYRPARAVKAFVNWAKLPDDPKAKATYYPALSKPSLFPGYIATISGHSRGSTVDLTLVALMAPDTGKPKETKPEATAAQPKATAGQPEVSTGQTKAPQSAAAAPPAPTPAPDSAPAAAPTAPLANAQAMAACTAPAASRAPDDSIDMGTAFDCFDVKANTHVGGLTAEQRANRAELLEVMQRHGFTNYAKEWWHYTLRGEPYPKTIFDFPILPRSAEDK